MPHCHDTVRGRFRLRWGNRMQNVHRFSALATPPRPNPRAYAGFRTHVVTHSLPHPPRRVTVGWTTSSSNFQTVGIKRHTHTMKTVLRGTPILEKSENLYPPGAHTIMLVWYPMGVMKEADAATMMHIRKGFHDTPSRSATLSAIGKMRPAAALLVVNSVMTCVMAKRKKRVAWGLMPASLTPFPMVSARPLSVIDLLTPSIEPMSSIRSHGT
mmetsp:Transcript_51532/g.128267  ORF Transcript_51532/g.128267 Transcript_51532/m.128267 type:complete len:213 (-) Transcript_51532:721-1359(-)